MGKPLINLPTEFYGQIWHHLWQNYMMSEVNSMMETAEYVEYDDRIVVKYESSKTETFKKVTQLELVEEK